MSLFKLFNDSHMPCFNLKYGLKRNFFMPYECKWEVAVDVADPLLMGALAVAAAYLTATHGFMATFSLLQSDVTGAENNIKQAGVYLSYAFMLVIAAIISPLTSLISLIGRSIATAGEQLAPGRFSQYQL